MREIMWTALPSESLNFWMHCVPCLHGTCLFERHEQIYCLISLRGGIGHRECASREVGLGPELHQIYLVRCEGKEMITLGMFRPICEGPFSSVRIPSITWHQIRHDYPLNLSILISGGKEINRDAPSNGEWREQSPIWIWVSDSEMWIEMGGTGERHVLSDLERSTEVGDSPMWSCLILPPLVKSRAAWEYSLNTGGKFHPRLNITEKPIADKYCEGKVKRTLKRESKALEIAGGEPNAAFAWACRVRASLAHHIRHVPVSSITCKDWRLWVRLFTQVFKDPCVCPCAWNQWRCWERRGREPKRVQGLTFSCARRRSTEAWLLRPVGERASFDPSWNTDQGV